MHDRLPDSGIDHRRSDADGHIVAGTAEIDQVVAILQGDLGTPNRSGHGRGYIDVAIAFGGHDALVPRHGHNRSAQRRPADGNDGIVRSSTDGADPGARGEDVARTRDGH